MAAGVLSELVQIETDGTTIVKYFCNPAKVKLLQDLLNPSMSNKCLTKLLVHKKEDVKKVEGTNYGCPISGFYDYPIALLQRLIQKYTTDTKALKEDMISAFLSALAQSNMAETIVNIILTLGNQTDISPKGVVSLLTVIHESIFYNYKQLLHRLFKVELSVLQNPDSISIGQLCQIVNCTAD